jgi:YidC/Oxa1 family membrane protein insertase
MVRPGRNGVRPLDLETGDADVDARLREALFRPSAETVTVSRDGEGELVFIWAAGGLEAEKRLRFLPGGDLVQVSAVVKRDGRPLPVKVLFGPGLGTATKEEKGVTGYLPPQGIVLAPSGVERVPADKLTETRSFSGVKWIGLENRYFAALFVPGGKGSGEIRPVSVPVEDGKTETTALLGVSVDSAPALLFVGAKDYHSLRGLGHSLEEVVDTGSWIGPIVKPLLSILPRVYGVLGNYGWSILALTVVINLIMAPLRHYGIANSLRMAKVAPEVRAIQERYRKVPLLERQAMNDEVQKVYESHGMNMGTQMTVGCLPMLLTMPFLFAIYRVLQVSIELKGAPFIWIPDLSQQDPYYLTPVLMGVSMLIMQRLTPAGTMDPAQQKMMMVMPVVFTAMFVAAPAGLNLYWLASNVCSIVQQSVTMRLLKGREAATPQIRGKGKK